MKNSLLIFCALGALFLQSCAPNTLNIDSTAVPRPEVLLARQGGVMRDFSAQIGSQFSLTIPNNEGSCAFALFASTGSFQTESISFPPPTGIFPTPSTANFITNTANAQLIPFVYFNGLNGAGVRPNFILGEMGASNKDMHLVFESVAAPSWQSETPIPQFTSQTILNTKVETWVTIADNISAGVQLRYVGRVGMNVTSTGNFISLLFTTWDFAPCNITPIRPSYTNPEVFISYQPFNTPRQGWYQVPASFVTGTQAGEVIANIPTVQPQLPGLKNAHPAPGIYHILMRYTDATNRHSAIVEITNAFVSLRYN